MRISPNPYTIERALPQAYRLGHFVFVCVVRPCPPQGTPDVDGWYLETLGM